MGDKVQYKAWIVNCRGRHDTEPALHLCRLQMYGTSPAHAWRNFLALVGKDRPHWNRLGYIAEQVQITVQFLDEKP